MCLDRFERGPWNNNMALAGHFMGKGKRIGRKRLFNYHKVGCICTLFYQEQNTKTSLPRNEWKRRKRRTIKEERWQKENFLDIHSRLVDILIPTLSHSSAFSHPDHGHIRAIAQWRKRTSTLNVFSCQTRAISSTFLLVQFLILDDVSMSLCLYVSVPCS